MTGMHARTGRQLDGMAHIHQSVADILTTPIGSRVMRRDYGSLVPELLGQPLNDSTLLRIYAASVMALTRWEPRLKITAIRRQLVPTSPGQLLLTIEGETRSGDPVLLEVPVQ